MNYDENRIRTYAYQIWEAEGKPDGDTLRHWRLATLLVEAESAEEEPEIVKPLELIDQQEPETADEKAARNNHEC